MALPTLRQLSQSQYGLFKENLTALIEADGKLSLFEWVLRKVVCHHLDRALAGTAGAVRKTRLRQARPACAVLLSLLVYATSHDGLTEQEVFVAAVAALGEPGLRLTDPGQLSFGRLDGALDELAGLPPLEKARLVKACAACVLADRKVAPVETELLRAIAETLDSPLPPLVGH
jgi:hypothetical protein